MRVDASGNVGRIVVKVIRDITERRRADEALRVSVDSVKDYAVFMLDRDGTVASWNAGAARIKGYRSDEIIGKHFSVFYTQDDIAARKPDLGLEAASRDGRFEDEGWRVRRDGSLFWASVVISVLRDATGKICGFSKVTRDMTEKKRDADELKDMAERLLRSNRELEQFTYVASHDLQEPLRKIQAFADQLKIEYENQLGAEGQYYLERMYESAKRMRGLIDGLLTFERVSKRDIKVTTVDLSEVVAGILSDLDTWIKELCATVKVEALPTIDADPVQMRQLLENLLGNALKFHRPDVPPVVTVSARCRDTGERGGGATGKVCDISVADNGIGFEDKYTSKIFNLFQRLHGLEEYEGTGLGLAICRKIVERHGGTITAEGKPGEGAKFTATLPVR
jgi:PAS domain S-box-containing protein